MGHDDLIHELRTARKNLLAAKALVGFTDKQSQIMCLGTMNEAAMAMEEAIAALNTPDRSGTAREAPSTSLGTLSSVGPQAAGHPHSHDQQ